MFTIFFWFPSSPTNVRSFGSTFQDVCLNPGVWIGAIKPEFPAPHLYDPHSEFEVDKKPQIIRIRRSSWQPPKPHKTTSKRLRKKKVWRKKAYCIVLLFFFVNAAGFDERVWRIWSIKCVRSIVYTVIHVFDRKGDSGTDRRGGPTQFHCILDSRFLFGTSSISHFIHFRMVIL